MSDEASALRRPAATDLLSDIVRPIRYEQTVKIPDTCPKGVKIRRRQRGGPHVVRANLGSTSPLSSFITALEKIEISTIDARAIRLHEI